MIATPISAPGSRIRRSQIRDLEFEISTLRCGILDLKSEHRIRLIDLPPVCMVAIISTKPHKFYLDKRYWII
jgi:hypothetical protein